MVSGWVAVGYLAFIMTSLVVYARYYRRQKHEKLQTTEQFYPHKFNRDIYQSVHDAGAPAKLERAALLGWAVENVTRLMKLQEAKAAIQNLSQAGLIGEDLVDQVGGTEKLILEEMSEVVQGAEASHSGWSPTFVPAAQRIAQNNAIRLRLAELDKFRNEYLAYAEEAKMFQPGSQQKIKA